MIVFLISPFSIPPTLGFQAPGRGLQLPLELLKVAVGSPLLSLDLPLQAPYEVFSEVAPHLQKSRPTEQQEAKDNNN